MLDLAKDIFFLFKRAQSVLINQYGLQKQT